MVPLNFHSILSPVTLRWSLCLQPKVTFSPTFASWMPAQIKALFSVTRNKIKPSLKCETQKGSTHILRRGNMFLYLSQKCFVQNCFLSLLLPPSGTICKWNTCTFVNVGKCAYLHVDRLRRLALFYHVCPQLNLIFTLLSKKVGYDPRETKWLQRDIFERWWSLLSHNLVDTQYCHLYYIILFNLIYISILFPYLNCF